MVAYVGAYMVAYVGAYMVSYVGAYMVAYVGSYMIINNKLNTYRSTVWGVPSICTVEVTSARAHRSL